MAAGAAADRRRPLAVARSYRRQDAKHTCRRRARRLRVFSAEGSLPASGCSAPVTCASSFSRAMRRRSASGWPSRAHRFMPASLLPSQFAALEEPGGRGDRRYPATDSRAGAAHPRKRSTWTYRRRHERRATAQQGNAGRASGPRAAQVLGRRQHAGLSRQRRCCFPTVADLEAVGARRIDGNRLRIARLADGHGPAGRDRDARGRTQRRSPSRRD